MVNKCMQSTKIQKTNESTDVKSHKSAVVSQVSKASLKGNFTYHERTNAYVLRENDVLSVFGRDSEEKIIEFKTDKETFPNAITLVDNRKQVLVGNSKGITVYDYKDPKSTQVKTHSFPILPEIKKEFDEAAEHYKGRRQFKIHNQIQNIVLLADNKHFISITFHSYESSGRMSIVMESGLSTRSLWRFDETGIVHVNSQCGKNIDCFFPVNSEYLICSSDKVLAVKPIAQVFGQADYVLLDCDGVNRVAPFANEKYLLTSNYRCVIDSDMISLRSISDPKPIARFKYSYSHPHKNYEFYEISFIIVLPDDEHFIIGARLGNTRTGRPECSAELWNVKNTEKPIQSLSEDLMDASLSSIDIDLEGRITYLKKREKENSYIDTPGPIDKGSLELECVSRWFNEIKSSLLIFPEHVKNILVQYSAFTSKTNCLAFFKPSQKPVEDLVQSQNKNPNL